MDEAKDGINLIPLMRGSVGRVCVTERRKLINYSSSTAGVA
jgi:hypothetical protein